MTRLPGRALVDEAAVLDVAGSEQRGRRGVHVLDRGHHPIGIIELGPGRAEDVGQHLEGLVGLRQVAVEDEPRLQTAHAI